ncbi:MAG: hypothetical protein QOH32_4364 [Bradyrhizobium sp.]|jgi:hypothetical protein|nr:hypothetical protein [Bradyrhizobium sp.]
MADSNQMQEFLTPEAMLTPGVAGSLTMMITNALASNFDMPRAWMGLGLSFIFGLLVLVSAKGLIQKTVFYVLNSLVIFCVAVGTNGLGAGGAPVEPRVALLGIAAAHAQAAPPVPAQTLEHCANLSDAVATAQKNGASSDQIVALVRPCQNISQQLLKSGASNPQSKAASDTDASKKFFKPWKF